MLSIVDGQSLSRALTLPLEPRLAAFLIKRREQLGPDLEGARFVIVQPGDRPCWLEEVLGFSVFQNLGVGTWWGDPQFTPGWEWAERHSFGWELVFQFSEDAPAQVVLVEEGVKGDLRRLCEDHVRMPA